MSAQKTSNAFNTSAFARNNYLVVNGWLSVALAVPRIRDDCLEAWYRGSAWTPKYSKHFRKRVFGITSDYFFLAAFFAAGFFEAFFLAGFLAAAFLAAGFFDAFFFAVAMF